MNDLSTVKPLYPGAFPQHDADESDGIYPKAPLNLILGFDLETFQIPLEELMPSKKVPDGVMTTRKFKQIVSSIREIGLIEPLSVIKPDPEAAGFLLLDGNPFDDLNLLQDQGAHMPLIMKGGKVYKNALH